MNVATHYEREKNEKTGKQKAGEEERKQSTNFRVAASCPSAVVQRVRDRTTTLWGLLIGAAQAGSSF